MSESLTIDSHEYEGRFFSMEVEYDVEWENDGIGSYEYWGAKGYDKGNTYAVVDNYGICNLVEHLPDGTEVEIPESDPLFKKVEASISDLVDKDADNCEPDTDGQYDTERERDGDDY